VSGPYPTQTHPASNNGTTWTLADDTLSAITPGVREVTVTAWDPSGNAGTDATYNELTILGEVAGPVTSNLLTPGQAVSGARLELTAPSGTNYQWKKNGVNLTNSPPRVTGTTSQTLIISPLEASDSGSYTVAYQAGITRAGGLLETDPYDVSIDLFDFPGSFIMITSFSASPGGTVTIEWSDIGFNYTVEETTSLLFPAWSPAAGSWPMATNAWSGGISSTNNATFYRIIGQ
jgi:hypothetical protein